MKKALSRRVLLIGWDAADWQLIQPLLSAGLMPHLQQMMQRGVSGNISTLFPAYSPMLWTSIATGKRAYKHGILGFVEPAADGSGVQPISNRDRRSAALWNIVSESGGRSLVVGWWPTHPAEAISGVMVSDQFVPTGVSFDPDDAVPAGSVHPATLAETLGALRVHPRDLTLDDLRPFMPNIDELWAGSGSEAPACADLLCHAATIQAVATELLSTEAWDFSAVYFNSIDHFCHRFMRYHPPQLPWVSDEDFRNFRHVVGMCYQFHDMLLGNLLKLAGDDATVILMSDHGFRSDVLRRSDIPMEAAGPAAEHREYGIFAAVGPGIRENSRIRGVSLLDVAPTILTLMGLPTGRDMDGRVLTEIFESVPELSLVDSWDERCTELAGLPGGGSTGSSCLAGTVEAPRGSAGGVLQQLIDLGYVDAGVRDAEHPGAAAQLELDFNYGLSLFGGQRFREAAEQFQGLWLRRPADVRMPIRLAQCLERLDEFDELRRVLDHLEEFWQRIESEGARRVVSMAEHAAQRELAGAVVSEAAALLNSARLSRDEARVAQRLMQGHRVNWNTLHALRATVATSAGRAGEGLQHLEMMSPGNTQQRVHQLLQRARILLQDKRLDEALLACEECLSLDGESRAACMLAGHICLRARRPARALKYYQSATELLYEQPEAHLFQAIALGRLKRVDEAIAAAKVCCGQAPDDARSLKLLSSLYARQGEYSLSGHYEHLCESVQQRVLAAAGKPMRVILPVVDSAAIADVLRSEEFGERFDVHTLQSAPAGRVSGNVPVVVVSGLPRAGTSLMMQMLEAGGVRPLTDGVREADASNPRGYFEYQKSLTLFEDNSWLAEARDCAVKIVAPLFPLLPQGERYRVILMRRDIEEVLSSQAKMLSRLGKSVQAEAEQLRAVLQGHFEGVLQCCERHGIPVEVVDFAEVMQDPKVTAARLSLFLGGNLQSERMAAVVDGALYRERRGGGLQS